MWGKKKKQTEAPSVGSISGHVADWEHVAVDYVDGRLDRATEAAVRSHLESCPACAAKIALQQDTLAVLRETAMVAPPPYLEDRVLGEILFPRETARARPRSKPYSASSRRTWQGLRAWLPAAAAVVAVFVVMVVYGVTRGDDDATEMAVTSTDAVLSASRETDEKAGSAQDPSATSLDASGYGTLSTEADMVLGASGTTVASAALQPAGPYLDERQAMADGLASTNAPAYFFFAVNGGSLVTTEQADDIAALVRSTTGLRLMDQTPTGDTRVFAAFVPRDDASAIVDLLRSIGTSLQLSLNLSLDPGAAVSEWAESLLADKCALAELSATPAQAPAAAEWSYTTSTASPTTTGSTPAVSEPSPDEAGTHVLVVILINVQM
jgi:hypothetical protein